MRRTWGVSAGTVLLRREGLGVWTKCSLARLLIDATPLASRQMAGALGIGQRFVALGAPQRGIGPPSSAK